MVVNEITLITSSSSYMTSTITFEQTPVDRSYKNLIETFFSNSSTVRLLTNSGLLDSLNIVFWTVFKTAVSMPNILLDEEKTGQMKEMP